ncbi:MAG TPA: VWA domain-containing protein [Vicinamibacterales bacterium]
MSRQIRLACMSVLLAATSISAQQQPSTQQPPTTFKSGSGAIVSIFATVSDADRRLVPGLELDDFEVLDNEQSQPIVIFDNKVQPITVIVMLDTSGSMTNSIALLRQAAEQFVLRLLPADHARVGAFNDKIQLSSKFTNNRDELVSDIKDLDYGNGTRLWDAVNLSLDELKGVEGRKVILVFTDGDDTASKASLGKVTDRARDEDVMVYSIGLESEYFDGQRVVRTKPDRGLRKISDETGGGFFELKKNTELASTFTRVAQELHSQYALGFEAKQLDGKLHKLAVRMKKPGMTARARRSYMAVKKDS